MSDKWFFTTRGVDAGPVSWMHLQLLAANGQISPVDQVWCEGMAQRVAASQVPGLLAVVGAATAPVAVAPLTGAAGDASDCASNALRKLLPAYALADPFNSAPAIGARYAGFWLRFMASFADALVLCAVIVPVIIGFVFMMSAGQTAAADEVAPAGPGFSSTLNHSPLAGLGLRLLIALIAWLYFAVQESSAAQATIGKRMFGLVVTDTQGQRISFLKASGRHFGKILSQITLMLGYVMAGITERKQALHDMLASCLVLTKD